MKLTQEIYVGGSVQDLGTVVYSLKRGIPVLNLYCICLFLDNGSKIEILSSLELCNKRYANKKISVVGVAYGKTEAVDLLVFILDTAIKDGKNINKPQEWVM